jgi:hypothetical protein
LIGYSFFLGLVGLSMLVIVYGMQHQATTESFILMIVDRLMHLLRRTYDPTPIRNAMENIYVGLALLRNRGWIRPAIGSGRKIPCFFLRFTLFFTLNLAL